MRIHLKIPSKHPLKNYGKKTVVTAIFNREVLNSIYIEVHSYGLIRRCLGFNLGDRYGD